MTQFLQTLNFIAPKLRAKCFEGRKLFTGENGVIFKGIEMIKLILI